MAKTVVGSFGSYQEAEQVVQDLESGGVPRADISIVASDATGKRAAGGRKATTDKNASPAATGAVAGGAIGGAAGLVASLAGLAIPGIGPVIAAGPIVAALSGAGIGAVAGGLIGGLVSVGVPEEHAGYYAEAVRRGGALVTVRAEDEMAERVAEIMNRHGALDIDRQAAGWRERGWSAFDERAQPLSAEDVSRERETVLPVVEEGLQVSKRKVDRGGVRVFTRVTEEPVEEQVSLREEHARVERRPVDRPATQADLTTFKEGTIEVRERAEEPVVSKRAHVVEEVVVGKETTERTETVRDTVRRTEVDVQPLGAGRSTADYDDRQHFERTFGSAAGSYDDYVPAYRYGHDLAENERYRGRDWASIEGDVRNDWERANPGSAWERFKAAVRHGWDSTTGAVSRATSSDDTRPRQRR